MAARYSSAIAPRRSNGMPSAAYSRSDSPTPTPSTKRPPLNRSMLAATRAVSSGLRYGRIATVVPSSMRSVWPADHEVAGERLLRARGGDVGDGVRSAAPPHRLHLGDDLGEGDAEVRYLLLWRGVDDPPDASDQRRCVAHG